MPVRVVKISLEAPDNASLASARQALDDARASVPVSVRRAWATGGEVTGRHYGVLELSVTTAARLTTLRTALAGTVSTLRGLGIRGRIHAHLCSHSDPVVVDCTSPAASPVEVVI